MQITTVPSNRKAPIPARMSLTSFILLAILPFATPVEWKEGYQNTMDDPLCVTCHKFDTTKIAAVSRVQSEHQNYEEDRFWKFSCSDVLNFDSEWFECFWSDYFAYQSNFKYHCGTDKTTYNQYVITGAKSEHDNSKEDRQWSFRCCKMDGYCVKNCEWSSYTSYDKYFDVQAPSGKFLQGVQAHWDGYYK